MFNSNRLVQTLRIWGRMPIRRLLDLLQTNRTMLMRAVRAAGLQALRGAPV